MTAPGIDISVLMDAACNDRDMAIDLMKMFFDLSAKEQIRIADAVSRHDHAGVSAVAHKLAGSCIACGMAGLSARFKDIEHLSKAAMPEDIRGRLQTIDRELQDIRRSLENHFNCTLGAGA